MPDFFEDIHKQRGGSGDLFDQIHAERQGTGQQLKPGRRSVGEFLTEKLPESAGNLLTDAANAAIHPIDTLSGAAKIGGGLIQKMSPNQSPATTGLVPYADAVIDYEKNRYGNKGSIAKTLYNDPVGALGDASAVLDIGGLGIKGAAEAAKLAKLPKVAKIASEVGDAARTAGKYTNPLLPAQKVAGAALEGSGKLIGGAAKRVASAASGVPLEDITRAFQNPSEALKSAMRNKTSETQIVGDVQDALGNIRKQRGAKYVNEMGKIKDVVLPGRYLTDITDNLDEQLKKFNIDVKVSRAGKIDVDFGRSPITEKSAQSNIQQIVHDVFDWGSKPGDTTIGKFDILKRRMDAMYSESKQDRAFVSANANGIRKILKQSPEYAKIASDYEESSDLIKKIEDGLSAGSNAKEGTAIGKITSLMGQKDSYKKMLLEALDQYTTKDIRGQIAGYHMKHWFPEDAGRRGALGPVLGIEMVGHGMHPVAAAGTLAASSPRTIGETMVMLSAAKQAASMAKSAIPPVIRSVGPPAIRSAAVIGSRERASLSGQAQHPTLRESSNAPGPDEPGALPPEPRNKSGKERNPPPLRTQ